MDSSLIEVRHVSRTGRSFAEGQSSCVSRDRRKCRQRTVCGFNGDHSRFSAPAVACCLDSGESTVQHLAHARGGHCNETDGMRGRPPRAWRAATDASGELELRAGGVKSSSQIPSLVRRAACHDRGMVGVLAAPRKNDSARSRIAPAPSARCSCRVLDFQRWTTQFATSDADRLDCSANTGDREKTPSRREHATSITQNPAAIAICQLFIGDLRVDAVRGGIR